MKKITVVAVGAFSLLIGIAIGSSMKDAPEPLGPSDDSSAAEIRRLDHETERLEADLAAAEARERASHERAAELAAELAAAEPEPAGEASAAPVPPETVAADPGPKARFMSETYPSLGRVKWKEVGTSLRRMPQLIAAAAKQVVAGKQPDPATLGKISQLNGNLVTAALTIRGELPGHAPNGSFTDPAFMSNAIVATLIEAELPLDERQLEALEGTARTFVERDRLRRGAYDGTTYELQKIREEAELKDRFFAAAFEHLTEAQVNALEPEEIRRRIRLSLFSSGTMLVIWARPFPFAERSEIVEGVFRTVQRAVGLESEEEEVARLAIDTWLGGVPPILTDEPGNGFDLEGMVKTERVTAWAKQTQDLLELLAGRLGFDETRAATARGVQLIPVPVKKPAEER